MRIRDILTGGKPTLSFEVFPPETEDACDSVKKAVAEIAKLKPSFVSVTYRAGRGTNEYTVGIASAIKKEYGMISLAHLTYTSSTREEMHHVLGELEERGTENVLALRRDIPQDGSTPRGYHYTSELIRGIKKAGDFCVGAACYPEGHVESASKSMDIDCLKQKVKTGCDFVTTQMFFDSSIFYSYLHRIREKRVQVPVIAGIIPMTDAEQMRRITQMPGIYLPSRFMSIVDRFRDDSTIMKQAGTAYAMSQIIDLIVNGANGIHVYSMNKPDVAMKIKENLSGIL